MDFELKIKQALADIEAQLLTPTSFYYTTDEEITKRNNAARRKVEEIRSLLRKVTLKEKTAFERNQLMLDEAKAANQAIIYSLNLKGKK